jgi:hypothetical protein
VNVPIGANPRQIHLPWGCELTLSTPPCILAVFRPVNASSQNTNRQRRCDVQCHASAHVSSESSGISRRAAIGGSIALASVAALQSSLPAEARVVSSDWEKVDLPVDPGVVLLDIGFTDEKHGECGISARITRDCTCDEACWRVPAYCWHAILHLLSPTSSSNAAVVPFCHSVLISTLPAHAGFLLGSRETLLETKDGGRTWEPRSVAAAKDEGSSPSSVHFSHACHCLVQLQVSTCPRSALACRIWAFGRSSLCLLVKIKTYMCREAVLCAGASRLALLFTVLTHFRNTTPLPGTLP